MQLFYLEGLAEIKKEEVGLVETNKTKEPTYTQDQVRHLVADVIAELVFELEDPSLVIAGMLAMKILAKKLK